MRLPQEGIGHRAERHPAQATAGVRRDADGIGVDALCCSGDRRSRLASEDDLGRYREWTALRDELAQTRGDRGLLVPAGSLRIGHVKEMELSLARLDQAQCVADALVSESGEV